MKNFFNSDFAQRNGYGIAIYITAQTAALQRGIAFDVRLKSHTALDGTVAIHTPDFTGVGKSTGVPFDSEGHDLQNVFQSLSLGKAASKKRIDAYVLWREKTSLLARWRLDHDRCFGFCRNQHHDNLMTVHHIFLYGAVITVSKFIVGQS